MRVDGAVYELDAVPALTKGKQHTIEAVVDRLIIREGVRTRIAESVQLALRHGPGLVVAAVLAPGGDSKTGVWNDLVFSTQHACPICGLSYEELEPRTFSFNSPYGACRTCDGLGAEWRSIQTWWCLIRAYRWPAARSLRGAAPPATVTAKHRRELAPFAATHEFRWNTPLESLKPQVFDTLFEGDGSEFAGIHGILDREFAGATTPAALQRWEKYRGIVACPACHGSRLRAEARSVKIAGRAIQEVTGLTVEGAKAFFASLAFEGTAAEIAEPIIAQISSRLDFLANVGLAYLTLDRAADSLSGGELQRIRLASSIGSGLVGVCYVLDEPSIGLHPRDNERLIRALRDLEQQGNSVLVVEHDEAIMRGGSFDRFGARGGRCRRPTRRARDAGRSCEEPAIGHRAILVRRVQTSPSHQGGRRISGEPSRWKESRPTI